MEKMDAKSRFIKWVLLVQEFDFEEKERKGTENQVADNLSRLEDEYMRKLGEKAEIDEAFSEEPYLYKTCPSSRVKSSCMM